MEKNTADHLLKALIGAYVWVASSDGNVDLPEYRKFGQIIVESPFATQFDESHIRRYFKDVVTLFENDSERAVQIVKSDLAMLAGQDYLCQEVIRISRAASVGDARLKDVEESTLFEISAAMRFKGPV